MMTGAVHDDSFGRDADGSFMQIWEHIRIVNNFDTDTNDF